MRKALVRKVAVGGVAVGSFFALAFAQGVFAQNTPISLTNPIGVSSFQGVVADIANFLLLIAVPLTAIMALIGGFQMITAGGNPEKFANGRKTLMYAAIGFAVVLIAGGVASIIKNFISGN